MFLAIMNNAAMNTCVYVFAWTYIFNSLVYMPRSGNSASYDNSMFSLLRNCRLFSKVAVPLYIPIISV